MENVVLTIHLILALCLIGVVLMQRSEGGGLGMGGGGSGAMAGRAAATALTKVTWILAVAFIITSITLTLIAADKASGTSVVDQFGGTSRPIEAPVAPLGTDLLPPAPANAPLTPPRADDAAPATAPATPPAGN
ncbi:preprotein translocase subunit SecG [Pseudorhodobacter antarcticus]|jgi:preprotein translocase subunit SecG|uniref:Protein-export membrane protein SecG n=1 Tax=Pseudorhodobacter antarcticus TaxID=1077947 RepID=A0A1H8GR67_9RHOB|nr:preprotein translocase subunit SecG [Pseudorhodobacter antarcticus]SEN45987.1 preprotein translocase subunit SecG [Pseudorhodobacter antarcticus]